MPSVFEGNTPEAIERNRGPFQMRIFGSAHSGTMGFMVRGDSFIKTIYDIGPETRVARPAAASEMIYALLAWLQLNKGPLSPHAADAEWNVKLISLASWEDNLRSIIDGSVDVGWATPENPLVREASGSSHGIRFLDLPVTTDPEGARRFRQVLPFGTLMPAPRQGVKEIWGVTSLVGTACFWCRADLDSGLAYRLTRWFDEHYDDYKDKGNKLYTYNREAFRWTLDVAMAPVHEGAITYFKEIGFWTRADDFRQMYNAMVMSCYCDAWDEAMQRADREGIAVSAASEAWKQIWADTKREKRLPRYRQMTDGEIQEGLTQLEHPD